jgi:hypothetical protein
MVNRGSNPNRDRYILFISASQTGCGARPTSYPMSTGASSTYIGHAGYTRALRFVCRLRNGIRRYHRSQVSPK